MRYIPQNKGFSLIEVIVLITVFTFAMGAVVTSVLYFYRSNQHTIEQAFAVDSARRGIEFMVRDIREAAYSDAGDYPVISISEDEFSFFSDIDRDNSIERVRYFIDGVNLRKGVTNATGDPLVYDDVNEVLSIVSDNVRNVAQGISTFVYFDDQGVVITDFNNITDVAFVRVNVVVNINPDRLPNEFTLRSSATLRNLKTNL
jgi:Tfp pilus assembly protein PilW